MAFPLNFNPSTASIGRTLGAFAPVTVTPPASSGVQGTITDQAAIAAWVQGEGERRSQAILETVRARSAGEYVFPDGRFPCSCGPRADNLDSLKSWDGDPAWCVRKDGPITAPVDRTVQNCSEMPALFWPDVWDAARALLRDYLARPPAQSADSVTQALWCTRVFELCSAMATATNISPALFCSFMSNPVNMTFQPRVRLELDDTIVHAIDGNGNVTGRGVRVWITRPVPGQSISQREIADAIHGAEPMQANTLPPLPTELARLWACPMPAGADAATWFGGREARVPLEVTATTSDNWNEETQALAWQAYGGVPQDVSLRSQVRTQPRNANRWMDDALTPAYFKSTWNLVRQQANGVNFGGMLPEWVCENSRTKAWMLGNMEPFRVGGFIWDGLPAWPTDMMGGGDPRATIQSIREHEGIDTFGQFEALFRAMGGRSSAPGWIFYGEWYKGENVLSAAATGNLWIPYQRVQLGQGYVPGAAFYMSSAYRWAAWLCGLEYTTVVNSALYAYVSNYLPHLVSEYSFNGVMIATPAQVQALHAQVVGQFHAASAQASAVPNLVGGAIVALATALAGSGVGMVLGIALALVGQLVRVFNEAGDSAKAALATYPVYSPTIRTPVSADCHLDAGSGAAALAAGVSGVTAPAATAAILTFMAQAQALAQQTGTAGVRAPSSGLSTGAKVGLAAAGVAALGALVLALRKR